MALPNSHMSVTLALSSDMFFRRAEAAAKDAPGPSCPPDVTIPFGGGQVEFADIVMQPSNANFIAGDDGKVFLDVSLQLQGKILGATTSIQGAALRLLLKAATADEQTMKLSLTYVDLLLPGTDGLPDAESEKLKGSIGAALSGTAFPFSIAPLVAEDRVLEGQPELVVAAQNSAGYGKTVVIGLEIEDDPGVDKDAFLAAFDEDPLANSASAWRLDVDSELMRERVAEELAGKDFTDPEDGIPGWTETKDTRALWSGDPLDGNLYFQKAYIEDHSAEHAVWFFLDGVMTMFGVPTNVYVAGNGDIEVDDEEGAIVFKPTIYAVGSGFVPFPIPAEGDDPMPVAEAEVADAMLATATGFDEARLTVRGVDEHPGAPGSPQIDVPDSLDVDKPVFGNDQEAKREFAINNGGPVPLWVCELRVESAGNVFSTQLPTDLPLIELSSGAQAFAVPPQGEVPVQVKLSPGDNEPHSGELVIRSNDFDSPRVKIEVSGQIEEEKKKLIGVPRIPKPRPIDPQEWFDIFRELVITLDDIVNPELERDHELELTFHGLSQRDEVDVLDSEGHWLGLAQDYGTVRHVSLPVGESRDFRLATTSRASALEVHLMVSQRTKLGEHGLDDSPRAMVGRGSLVAVAGRHHVSILSLADPAAPREISVLELGGVESLELMETELVAHTDDGTLEFFSLEDPHQPRHVHSMDVREARVHMSPAGLALETAHGTRVYAITPAGRPRLTRELPSESGLPVGFRGRSRRAHPRDRSWGTSPFLPEGRFKHDRYVLELVEGASSPTLRVSGKTPSGHVFDVPRLRALLKAEERTLVRP